MKKINSIMVVLLFALFIFGCTQQNNFPQDNLAPSDTNNVLSIIDYSWINDENIDSGDIISDEHIEDTTTSTWMDENYEVYISEMI